MSKRRDENAPWSAAIRNHPSGLPGVVAQRLDKQGSVAYTEVMEGANASRGCAKRIFERLVLQGKAVATEQGIAKVSVEA